MSSDYTVGDLFAEFLTACGVTTAFGIASIHNIPILDAIGRRNVIRFIMARGEAGGAHMADGYARVSNGLGVIISSTGPGAANAVGGLIEARFAGSPVLHITGMTSTKFSDREVGIVHDPINQIGMLGSVCKAAYRIRSAQHAIGILTRAVTEALTPPFGPVSIEVPIDLQREKIARPAVLDGFVLPVPPCRTPSDFELNELATRVQAARRPMMWIGSGARHAGAEIEKLIDLGFTVVNSINGKGTVPDDHPMSLGGLHGNGLPMIEELYRTVDLLLVVGSRLRGQDTAEFNLKLPGNIVHIDIDPAANSRTYRDSYFVCGDAKATLAALLPKIEGKLKVDPDYRSQFGEVKKAARAAFLGQLGVYGSFSDQLRAVMPKDAIWVRDITQSNSTWGNRVFPVATPSQSVYPVGAGIGQGLQLGIGAAAAAGGRKTVVITGDGGFFLNVGEWWTPIQERLDMTVIVMNDRGYGVIKRIQDATEGRRFFADLLAPDLRKFAAVSDIPYFRCSSADSFGKTVAEAIAIKGLSMVEVDMTAIGEFPVYYPFNVKRQ